MRQVILIIIFLTLTLVESNADWNPPSIDEIKQFSTWGVVRIEVEGIIKDGKETKPYRSTGTGFIITDLGYVITAAHLLPYDGENNEIVISGSIGPIINATYALPMRIIALDRGTDVALLQFTILPKIMRPLPISVERVRPGQNIYLLTYSGGSQNIYFIPGVTQTRDGKKITFSGSSNQGDSGAPIIDTQGYVIGIVSNRIDQSSDGTPISGINRFVPADQFIISDDYNINNIDTIFQEMKLQDEFFDNDGLLRDFGMSINDTYKKCNVNMPRNWTWLDDSRSSGSYRGLYRISAPVQYEKKYGIGEEDFYLEISATYETPSQIHDRINHATPTEEDRQEDDILDDEEYQLMWDSFGLPPKSNESLVRIKIFTQYEDGNEIEIERILLTTYARYWEIQLKVKRTDPYDDSSLPIIDYRCKGNRVFPKDIFAFMCVNLIEATTLSEDHYRALCVD